MYTSRLFCFEQIQPVALDWLWFPYLARGKLALLEGEPGAGKSFLTIDLAARLSRGGAMPDGRCFTRRHRTLFINGEDHPATALRPRLDAAGAHLGSVFALGGVGTETERVRLIADRDEIGDVIHDQEIDLVVIDSLSAFFPTGARGYNERVLPAALVPLAELAAEQDVAVLLVRRTEAGKSRREGPGLVASQGAIGTALELRRGAEADARVVSLVKTSIGPMGPALGCRLVEDAGSLRVEWAGVEAETAPVVLEEADLAGALEAAKVWLKERLAQGPVPARVIFATGKEAGHSRRTLERAKAELQIASEAEYVQGRREWSWIDPAVPLAAEEPVAPVVPVAPVAPVEAERAEGPGEEVAEAGSRIAMAVLAALNVKETEASADEVPRREGRGPP